MTVITLQPSGASGVDTYIDAGSPTFNYGASTTLAMTNASPTRRTFIKFDIAGAGIPVGVSIVSAIVTLSNIASSGGPTINVNRITTVFFEGARNGAAPLGGENGSTWNLRNANGSVAYSAGPGGDIGVQIGNLPAASFVAGGANNFDLTAEVDAIYHGTVVNNGWAFTPGGGSGFAFTFASANHATASLRPKLVITYETGLLSASVSGTSTAVANPIGVGRRGGLAVGTSTAVALLTSNQNVRGLAVGTSTAVAVITSNQDIKGLSTGTSTAIAFLTSNQNIRGLSVGTSTATAVRKAFAKIHGNSFGNSTAIAVIHADYHSVGSAAGTSAHVAHLKGRFNLHGTTAGVGTAIAHIIVKGHIFGLSVGTSTATAKGYARAVNVAAVIGCNPVPLLHITDGSVKPNGQLNILNFLGDRAGYFLVNYKPQIAQYKDGGYWSSSPQSQGRRLRGKAFDNVIDIVEVSARAASQDALIQYQQDLLDFQEAASDYWASDYNVLPFYLVARAARETNVRYSVIHMISCPELENPYTQPFFDDAVGSTFVSLTIRIEHGMWMSTPPGKFDCVEVSARREWTVSGWQVIP